MALAQLNTVNSLFKKIKINTAIKRRSDRGREARSQSIDWLDCDPLTCLIFVYLDLELLECSPYGIGKSPVLIRAG